MSWKTIESLPPLNEEVYVLKKDGWAVRAKRISKEGFLDSETKAFYPLSYISDWNTMQGFSEAF
jgi:hypothetical protein